MQVVVTSDEMRACDARAARTCALPTDLLMEHAALGVVAAMERRFGPLRARPVVVLCGKGHNGGDGLAVARLLLRKGVDVTAALCVPAAALSPAARLQARRLRALLAALTPPRPSGLVVLRDVRTLPALPSHGIIVDALFGTGFHGTPAGLAAKAIGWMNAQPAVRVSVDIPSGLDSDTGGAGRSVVRADLTVTFQAWKLGLLAGRGPDHAGEVTVVDIGIPGSILERQARSYRRIDRFALRTLLPPRPRTAHKHSVGKILVLAGSVGLTGAALLAAEAAMRSGAGAVILCVPRSVYPVLARRVAEIMVVPVSDGEAGTFALASHAEIAQHLGWADVTVVGPGLGRTAGAAAFLRRLLESYEGRLIVDADGLNAVVGAVHLLRHRRRSTVITPHVGECARLTGSTAAAVEAERFTLPREFARRHRLTMVLKGAPTVVAGPEGPVYVNGSGNPGMATAGAGDVLSGILASLWAQIPEPTMAACAAVHLHGLCGDIARDRFGERALLAHDLIEALPAAFAAAGKAEEA